MTFIEDLIYKGSKIVNYSIAGALIFDATKKYINHNPAIATGELIGAGYLIAKNILKTKEHKFIKSFRQWTNNYYIPESNKINSELSKLSSSIKKIKPSSSEL